MTMTTPSETLSSTFDVIDYAANVTVPDAAELLSEAADAQGLMILLAAVQDARKILQAAEAEVEARIAPLVPHGQPLVIEGVGTAEWTMKGKRSKWDAPGALRSLVQRIVTDPATGEMDPAQAEAANAVLEHVLDVAAVSYLRKGKLKARGINPDLYVEEEGGSPGVIFRRVSQADD